MGLRPGWKFWTVTKWRKKDGLLPMVGILWIDSAESQCVVGQRKMSCAATGNRNMSRVSPGLWYWYLFTSQILSVAVAGSVVVVAVYPNRRGPGSVPRGPLISSLFVVAKLAFQSNGAGGS